MSERELVLDAIHLIQRYLRKEYIVESCKDERVMGCASCTMTRLHEDLQMLEYEIECGEVPNKPTGLNVATP